MSNPVPPKLSTITSTSPQPLLHSSPTLTLHAAQLASAACIARATSLDLPMNIAIVDSSLHLLHFQRMPGAKLTSVDIAINKAYTAAGHRAPTSAYKEMVWPGGAAYGINLSNQGRFMVIAGGVPILVDGMCVGAVGCSTGTPAQDEDVARAGVEAVAEEFGKAGRVRAKL
ncbi:MAG: hypothetical protein MMC23_001497 [Stictis urceolatum]|nr:hypothetical protein [Stictis urceolata]